MVPKAKDEATDDPVESAAHKAIVESMGAIHGLQHPHDRQRAARLIRDYLNKKFFPAPSEVTVASNRWLLRCYDFAREQHNKNSKNKFNKSEFVRAISSMNKVNADIPPSQRRGAAGTSFNRLYRHLDALLAEREKDSE